MKYALTITSDPNAYDWGDTDTIIFEYPKALPEGSELKQLIAEVVAKYGWERPSVDEIIEFGRYFIRNTADVDVVVEE